MQFIIYQKSANNSFSASTVKLSKDSPERSLEGRIQPGCILLIGAGVFKHLEVYFSDAKLLNCGIKEDKIELFRALKLNQKGNRNQPRRIIVNYSSVAAFKKSFNPFLRQRFAPADPACILIFTNENLLSDLSNALRNELPKGTRLDPISALLESAGNNPIEKEISNVLVGNSIGIRLTRAMIIKASQSESPVLILGESGTGKELIARQIFKHSLNFTKDFLILNCSAIPDTLFESEAFGHEKGSFTNALYKKTGLFDAADEGTLFLDEIGDLSLPNQAKLLRAIDSGEVRPVGSNETKKVKVRILAATNRNLSSMIRQQTFREDLFYRLNSLTIFAPPLREHPEDIPLIASAIWANKLGKNSKLSGDFLRYLKNYSWPGNVRELKTMLFSIIDLFSDISPGPEHIVAIRDYQKKTLVESQTKTIDDFNTYLKAQCRIRVLEVSIVLRDIKILLRPVVNRQLSRITNKEKNKMESGIRINIEKLENLCREPIFFKSRDLFERITRFRYLLDKGLDKWPDSPEALQNLWKDEMNSLFVSIDREFFEILWGKVDL